MDIRVPLTPAAAASVRHAIADMLSSLVSDRLLSDAQLVLSELVTNSVRHAGVRCGAMLHIAATLTDDALRLEVDDAGTTGEVVLRRPSIAGGGFGLNLVQALSRAWGVERDGHTRVWVELVR
jgi:serine/threonine-protein kinase RsbW